MLRTLPSPEGIAKDMTTLHRYWFEFDLSGASSAPIGVRRGCGVTAFSREDALQLLARLVFAAHGIPPIAREIDNVDISTLDPDHVIPNMGLVVQRGVWFPLGYT